MTTPKEQPQSKSTRQSPMLVAPAATHNTAHTTMMKAKDPCSQAQATRSIPAVSPECQESSWGGEVATCSGPGEKALILGGTTGGHYPVRAMGYHPGWSRTTNQTFRATERVTLQVNASQPPHPEDGVDVANPPLHHPAQCLET